MRLTKKMLNTIGQGMNDKLTIINDDLSHNPNDKELLEQEKICQRVNDWVYYTEQKRGYHLTVADRAVKRLLTLPCD